MKRLFLTVVVMLSMTMTFAEGEKMTGVDNAEAYEMNINTVMLSRGLGLKAEQFAEVDELAKAFSADMASVAAANKEARKAMMDNAIKKNLRGMHSVLNRKQYKTYLLILNATINNRGLND